jgi:magnesium-transporting ATPase (P-type)
VDEIRHLGEIGSQMRYNRLVYPAPMQPTNILINDSLEDDELIVPDEDDEEYIEGELAEQEEEVIVPSQRGMVFTTLYSIIENYLPPIVMATIKTFDFKSSLQRMSVIVKNVTEDLRGGSNDTDTYDVFVKGSPEALRKLARPETGMFLLYLP